MTRRFCTRPRFVAGTAGSLFVFEWIPDESVVGTVFIVPPFAEEMNRARRMFNLQARQLASHGYRLVMPDLYGTGDSAGDFADARWDIWQNDIASVVEAMDVDRKKPVWVLALRLGAYLAMDALSNNVITADRLILWSPCISGKQFMTQFLRMRLMASMIRKDGSEETTTSLRALADQGKLLEIAGYALSPDLLAHIDSLSLRDYATKLASPVHWFEVASAKDRPFPLQSDRIADEYIANGCRVQKEVVSGPQFWATPEIAIAADLLAATTSLLKEADLA